MTGKCERRYGRTGLVTTQLSFTPYEMKGKRKRNYEMSPEEYGEKIKVIGS